MPLLSSAPPLKGRPGPGPCRSEEDVVDVHLRRSDGAEPREVEHERPASGRTRVFRESRLELSQVCPETELDRSQRGRGAAAGTQGNRRPDAVRQGPETVGEERLLCPHDVEDAKRSHRRQGLTLVLHFVEAPAQLLRLMTRGAQLLLQTCTREQ